MTDPLPIPVVTQPVTGSARPPGSKSITNRALVCAALASGPSRLTGLLDSQDTRVMAAGLAALGVSLDVDWSAGTASVQGTAGTIPATAATIDCAASGTTMRFLSAVCGLGNGTYRLDGTARMRQRPIGDLLEALRSLGVDARAESPGDCPPVVIRSHGLRGGAARVRGATSSQFASGLALAAPCSRDARHAERTPAAQSRACSSCGSVNSGIESVRGRARRRSRRRSTRCLRVQPGDAAVGRCCA